MIFGVAINDLEKVSHLVSYRRWYNMLSRCYNPKDTNYKYYGAKGVKVCDEWLIFSNYKKWFDENYKENCHVDKDINGDRKLYNPENCKFVTPRENIREMTKRVGFNHLKGNKNPNYKPKEHYATNPTSRGSFKKVCERQGWNFKEFKEEFAGYSIQKNGSKQSRYYYN